MKTHKLLRYIIALVLGAAFIQGCSRYDPVPVSDCSKVVRHAQKVLGDLAPSHKEMMTDCKAASDNDRGCIMASSKKGEVAQCF
ncbi:hypothetical protein A9Q99_08830 [Gammaproteobacteria bacterium 45_16_T64]|nr:hypothetical protein A9Q99_08830 [Gammaproteobacteria bacterium 45_16_T64]